MYQPQAYDAASQWQIDTALELVPHLISLIDWKEESPTKQTILDFGCGPGFVTKNILLNSLQSVSNPYVYGLDISNPMIEFAKETYRDPAISYVVGDILSENIGKLLPKKFDKIFSMFTIHWIKEQRELLRNFHKMLKPGGEIAFYCKADSVQYSMFESLSKNPIWAPYMKDVKKYIPNSHYSRDFGKDMKAMLESAGFKVFESTVIPMEYGFESEGALLKMAMSVDPFYRNIPGDLQNDYQKDYLTSYRHYSRLENNMWDGRKLNYKMILVHAMKN